jgi:DtxR family transcriptional regulator, Mn-dependent transcriptional regulator
MNEQIIIQDILKIMAESEYEGRPVSRDTIVSELSLSIDQADRMIHDLEAAELIEPGTMKLAARGREYALHVVRAHRLYETYLAHKTGIEESRWHSRAHVEEHKMSASDVEKLARELNYPRYDPHGDPIPTATGFMPAKKGQLITEYPQGWAGRVVHVEDEPPQRYAILSSASIGPGTIVRISKKDDREMVIETEGCTFKLPVDVAGLLSVEPLLNGEMFDESLVRLSSLTVKEKATVAGLSSLCLGLERNRLLDLGLVPGTTIFIDLVSTSGNPVAYNIRGASIALRTQQADRVLIHKRKDKSNG